MNLLYVASELSPYAKTGGLGEVLYSLPPALKARGHSVSMVLPMYRSVAEQLKERTLSELQITVPLGGNQVTARIWQATTENGIRLFLVQRDEYFDRSHLYGNAFGDYEDSAARFIFFNKVVVELLKHIEPVPQILHLHDWQAGLIPALVRSQGIPVKCVFTIHNLAYQGSFWGPDFALTNLEPAYFSPQGLEFFDRLNLMKGGILLSHQLTTVSPSYAKEIQTPEVGCGLNEVIRENQHKLTGIINGIDDTLWNPAKDPHLAEQYSEKNLAGKEECKKAVLKKFKLKKTEAPLFVCISRFASQKGFDLLACVLDEFLKEEVRLIFMGEGDLFYQEYLEQLAKKHPDRVALQVGYKESAAHQLMAGADFFLIPSHYEPCGLNQLYSQRYGTVPIVHATGGLRDTVANLDLKTGSGSGIRFENYEPAGLEEALRAALMLYKKKTILAKVRKTMMKRDFSWAASAAQYEEVYRKALEG